MPRSSGGGGRSSYSRSSSYRPARNPPRRAARAPAPAPTPARSTEGGLKSTIVDGFGWGTGMAVAHRAVDSLMGPRVIHHEDIRQENIAAPAYTLNNDASAAPTKAFQECLNYSGSDISKCQFYMDMLSQCHGTSASADQTASDGIFLLTNLTIWGIFPAFLLLS